MMRLIRTHKMRRTMTACANASDTPLTARNSIITAKPPVSNFYINTVKMLCTTCACLPSIDEAPSASAHRFPYSKFRAKFEYCGPCRACVTSQSKQAHGRENH